MLELKQAYDTIGLETFPVPFGQKAPPPKGWQTADNLWDRDYDISNIAIRLGKVADLESDNQSAEGYISNRLDDLGIHRVPVFSSPRGKHHFVKIKNAPTNTNFSLWKSSIGKGECRIRNCYSLIPPSVVDGRDYSWNEGWFESFKNLPEIDWNDLKDMVNESITTEPVDTLPKYLSFEPKDWIYDTLETLTTAGRGEKITSQNRTWNSRSEAEFAIALTLDICGFSNEQITSIFDEYKPGHYKEASNQKYYLNLLFDKIAAYGIRPELVNLYNQTPDKFVYHRVYKALISMSHQVISTRIHTTLRILKQITNKDAKNLMSISKAITKLEQDNLIKVDKGLSWNSGIKGKSNSYTLLLNT